MWTFAWHGFMIHKVQSMFHLWTFAWHGSPDILSNTLRADFHYFFILAFNQQKHRLN